jgi:phage terminase large subunit-like protein
VKSDIRAALEKRLAKIQSAETDKSPPKSTCDVIARCSPHLSPPLWLGPYLAKLDEAVQVGDVRCCFAAPPQHGKTLASQHGLIYAVMHDAAIGRIPRQHAYSTFNFQRAYVIRDEVQKIAFNAGLDPHGSSGILHLAGGARIMFGGASSGVLTGFKVDGIHIIDDPIKDRTEANSATLRERLWAWYLDVARTRTHRGSSIIAMMTRWHLDDLTGRLIKHEKFPYIRLPAECDSEDDPNGRALGEALWPAEKPNEWLAQFKAQPLTWASMYQGNPRPLGDALFDAANVRYYDSLPHGGAYRSGYGADLAYTEKTRADWSVLLGGRMYGSELYLTTMLRKQCQADRFTGLMRDRVQLERGPVLWFGSTTEKGIAQLIRNPQYGNVPTFEWRQAVEDKYVRATPTAEHLWNQSKVLMPRNAPWVAEFEEEVCAFTGVNDPADDQVDGLAALGTLFLRGYGGKMGVGALNGAIRAKLRLVS